MDKARILQLAITALENQRASVEAEINELTAQLKTGKTPVSSPMVTRRSRTAAEKKAHSERMKKYWAAKRKPEAKPAQRTKTGPQSAASRKAVSERMKLYWAEKRKAAAKAASAKKPQKPQQSAAARKAQSERMKQIWAKRRAEAGKKGE